MRSPVFVRALELTVPQNSCSNFATNHVKVCAPCMNFSILCEGPDITVIVPRYGIGFGCRCAQKSCKIMHAFFTWHMLDRTVFQLNEIVNEIKGDCYTVCKTVGPTVFIDQTWNIFLLFSVTASLQVNRQSHAWICAHISASDRDP